MRSKTTLDISTRHLPALDGMRGAAVLLVVTYHFGLLRFGWAGVWLFFVLSGYLITSILLETRSLGLGSFLGRFYWRRFLRIFPLYFGFIGLVMVAWLFTGFPSGAGTQFPWLATFSYNIYMALAHKVGLEQAFHHLWSISTEEQFYLVWPLLIWFLGRKGIGWLALGVLLVSPIVRFWEPAMAQSIDPELLVGGKFIYYFPLGHLDAFAMGGLLAAVSVGPWRKNPLVWGWTMCIPAILIACRSVVQYFVGQLPEWPIHLGFPMSSMQDGFHVWGYSAITLAFGGCMIFVLYGRDRLWIKRLAIWKPAQETGKISYGMYVFHWPLLLALEHYTPLHTNLALRLSQFMGYLLILVGISWLSHRYFESWFLRQKERLFAANR
jgi:peptidoglycan/LPS O-acetylase OafA/YrhL